MKEIVKYEISKDGIGLLAYFKDDIFYHIRSDELSDLECWILKMLKKLPLNDKEEWCECDKPIEVGRHFVEGPNNKSGFKIGDCLKCHKPIKPTPPQPELPEKCVIIKKPENDIEKMIYILNSRINKIIHYLKNK